MGARFIPAGAWRRLLMATAALCCLRQGARFEGVGSGWQRRWQRVKVAATP